MPDTKVSKQEAPKAQQAASSAGPNGYGCPRPGELDFADFEGLEGVDPDNIRSSADLLYVGTFGGIGAFRAVDALIARFFDGGDVGQGNLADKLCAYIRNQQLRVVAENRDQILRRLFRNDTLDRLMIRLADQMITWDLASRDGGKGYGRGHAPVTESTARLGVIAAVEDLEVFLDAEGGGGVGFVAHEAGVQLVEVFDILGDRELSVVAPGDDTTDVFAVIESLLTGEKDRPTTWEARQMARMAATGRKAFLEIANQVGPDAAGQVGLLARIGPSELETLRDLVLQWWVAHASLRHDAVEQASLDEEAAGKRRMQSVSRPNAVRLRSDVGQLAR